MFGASFWNNNPHLLSAAISQVHTGVKMSRAPKSLQILFSTFLTFLNYPAACMHEHILVLIVSVLAAIEVLSEMTKTGNDGGGKTPTLCF